MNTIANLLHHVMHTISSYFGCGLTLYAMPGIVYTQLLVLHEKLSKCPNETALHSGDNFVALTCQLYIQVTHKSKKGIIFISKAIVWYVRYNIRTHCIAFELSVTEKKGMKEKSKKINKIEGLMFGFLYRVK